MEKWKLTKLDPALQTRNFKAEWTYSYETVTQLEPIIDISKLTIDEQADLIIKKLSTIPKHKHKTEDEIMEVMAKSIADEIDREILAKIKKGLFK